MRRSLHKIPALMLALTFLLAAPAEIYSAGQAKGKGVKNKTAVKKSVAKSGSSPKGKQSDRQTAKKTTAAKATPRRSAEELKKQQQSAQAEIIKTREEIRRNEQEVKQGLNELSRLEDDITVSKKESATLSGEVGKLSDRISRLETSISVHQQELDRLRAEYLKAVKKMRVSRKRNSGFAYIFSAGDIAQADRRMRYLKEFSEWKDRQTKDINSKVETLKVENEQLKRAKSDKDVMLGRELKVQQKLTEQKKRQDAIVADLKANGDVLKAHLAKKQSEVNVLKNQVAAVIAEEQRKAEEQRRVEAERKRKQEAARAERERIEREQAEEAARRKAKEAAEKETEKKETPKGDAQKGEASKKEAMKKDSPKKETPKKDVQKNETPQNEPSKKDASKKDASENKNSSNAGKGYADARKRKPRGDSKPKSTPKKETPKSDNTSKETPKTEVPAKKEGMGDFASMRGSLPRPVSGAWRITGKFGRHALPDLPDVTYDNPGIDVEVSKGAGVSSIYQGSVSGVYMVPGFSTVIIVSHGDYYTVYGNVASASVKVGDNVKQGQHLGKVADDPDNPGHGSFHFEVWKGREKLNPANWIR